MTINLAKIGKNELTQLLQTARQEAAVIEMVAEPLKTKRQEISALRENEPIAKLSIASKIVLWICFFVFGVMAFFFSYVCSIDSV